MSERRKIKPLDFDTEVTRKDGRPDSGLITLYIGGNQSARAELLCTSQNQIETDIKEASTGSESRGL